VYTGFWWGEPEGRDHLQDPGIDGRIIRGGIFNMGCEGMDWIDVGQERNRWRALVTAVMNPRVP
jgi:hypothetical protein